MEHNNNQQQNFADMITEKIRSEGITPRSKYVTLLIQILLWIPWFFVTLIGIVGVAGIIFTVAFSGWQYHGAIRVPPFLYVMQTVSVVWLMCLVLFSAIVIKAFRITKKGYRVSPFTIITLSLVVSIAGGSLIYIGDRIVAQNQYFRRPVQSKQQQLWTHPYKGRMVGILRERSGSYVLEDVSGFLWKLDVGAIEEMLHHEGDVVRAVGIPLDGETFKVCAFFPLPLGLPPQELQRAKMLPLVSEEEKSRVYENAKDFSCGDIVLKKQRELVKEN